MNTPTTIEMRERYIDHRMTHPYWTERIEPDAIPYSDEFRAWLRSVQASAWLEGWAAAETGARGATPCPYISTGGAA